jgi:hypothetical protein
MYQITQYTKDRAKELGVTVQPSSNPKKKLDVYKDGVFLHSIGAIGYSDFPSYLRDRGREYAEKRRELYHIRHTKETLGELLSLYLLW